MSMLAEKKTKPSWVLNPRQSEWSKDTNKLGQKMLEKMGWSAGKGLGAKEQGPTDAIRIAYKGDSRGFGASRKKENEFWMQQQESFSSLLQELNGEDSHPVEVGSLEEKSKTAKKRVHYHKFTRGKDISRYSKKDLSCIVGAVDTTLDVITKENSKTLDEPNAESRLDDAIADEEAKEDGTLRRGRSKKKLLSLTIDDVSNPKSTRDTETVKVGSRKRKNTISTNEETGETNDQPKSSDLPESDHENIPVASKKTKKRGLKQLEIEMEAKKDRTVNTEPNNALVESCVEDVSSKEESTDSTNVAKKRKSKRSKGEKLSKTDEIENDCSLLVTREKSDEPESQVKEKRRSKRNQPNCVVEGLQEVEKTPEKSTKQKKTKLKAPTTPVQDKNPSQESVEENCDVSMLDEIEYLQKKRSIFGISEKFHQYHILMSDDDLDEDEDRTGILKEKSKKSKT